MYQMRCVTLCVLPPFCQHGSGYEQQSQVRRSLDTHQLKKTLVAITLTCSEDQYNQ